jgi:archaellum biogenesis protein FlaJ (TadC family)
MKMNLTQILTYSSPFIGMLLAYFLGKRKSDAETKKINSEIELTLTQKFMLEIEAAEKFRKLLIDENNSLKDELESVKTELKELKSIIKECFCSNAKTCKNRSKL